jgi:FkbM family methyltransferase
MSSAGSGSVSNTPEDRREPNGSETSELAAVEDGVLVHELARRLEGADAKFAGRVVEELTSEHELDYSGDTITLVVSSVAVARRLTSAEKEPFTVAYIEEYLKPGEVFYDIGANVGPYALIASKATEGQARVYAFEPSPASFRDLAHNVEANGCTDSVTPIPVALWSETRMLPVSWKSPRAGAAQHHLGEWSEQDGAHQLTLAMSLDDAVESLGIPVPNHAKIDVDGGELHLLRGALRTLANPAWRSVLIELDRGETDHNREVADLLRSVGFGPGVRQQRPSRRPDRPVRRSRYWIFTRFAEAA